MIYFCSFEKIFPSSTKIMCMLLANKTASAIKPSLWHWTAYSIYSIPNRCIQIFYIHYILYRQRALEKANNFATMERQTQFPQTIFTAEFDIFGHYDRWDRDAMGMSKSKVGGD